MKILILNGSPRGQGNISAMLAEMRQQAQALGHSAVEIKVGELRIRPCTGCMRCRSEHKCCLPEDDSTRVLRQIAEADALVVGAPCYWGNLPGETKLLFDRIVYGMIRDGRGIIPRPLHKGKKALVVATSTAPFPLNVLFHHSQGVVREVKGILRLSGFKVVSSIQVGGTRRRGVTQRTLSHCRKAVMRLCKSSDSGQKF